MGIEISAAAQGLPETVPRAHVMVNKFGTMVGLRYNTGFGYNFTAADFLQADKLMPEGAPHTGELLYASAAVAEATAKAGELPEAVATVMASDEYATYIGLHLGEIRIGTKLYTANQMSAYASAAVAECRRDAERYRFLRAHGTDDSVVDKFMMNAAMQEAGR